MDYITEDNVCELEFTIPNDLKPPIYLYYRMTNFYQNHRRYVKSLDVDQLKGKAVTKIASDCDPLRQNGTLLYYPCGLIANSLFNDTFDNFTARGFADQQFYNLTEQGVAWDSERSLYGESSYTDLSKLSPPPNWQSRYPDGSYEKTGLPNLHTWDAFQVWMRTAGLPTFSKLAMKNENDVLRAGTYSIKIFDRMPHQ